MDRLVPFSSKLTERRCLPPRSEKVSVSEQKELGDEVENALEHEKEEQNVKETNGHSGATNELDNAQLVGFVENGSDVEHRDQMHDREDETEQRQLFQEIKQAKSLVPGKVGLIDKRRTQQKIQIIPQTHASDFEIDVDLDIRVELHPQQHQLGEIKGNLRGKLNSRRPNEEPSKQQIDSGEDRQQPYGTVIAQNPSPIHPSEEKWWNTAKETEKSPQGESIDGSVSDEFHLLPSWKWLSFVIF